MEATTTQITFPVQRSAEITPDGKYQYYSTRLWKFRDPAILFIGLHPSPVDGNTHDDAETVACAELAKRWGYGTLHMTHLFGLRTTGTAGLKDEKYPVGPRANEAISAMGRRSKLVIFCWGDVTAPALKARAREVIKMFPEAKCLGFTEKGAPVSVLSLGEGESDAKVLPIQFKKL